MPMKLKSVYADASVELKVSKNPPAWWFGVRPAANLLVCTEEGKILVMHEYKAAVKRWMWGFPGGMIEDGETAAQAAKRECEEELGIRVARTKKICTVKTDFPDTSVSYFLGSGIKKGERKNWEREKVGSVKEVTLEELMQLASDGTIEDPRMVATILRLDRKVREGQLILE